MRACGFFFFQTPSFSLPLSLATIFCFSVSLCARACIWHLSGGLRVMPWSCRKLGHCSMYTGRCPAREAASLRVSFRATGNNATTGFFLLTLVCPKTNKLSSFPWQLECNNKNCSWNTTPCVCNRTQQNACSFTCCSRGGIAELQPSALVSRLKVFEQTEIIFKPS